MDDKSLAATAHVTIGANHTHNNMGLTATPTQVTIGATHTQNSIDIDNRKNYKEDNGGEKDDDDGNYAIDSPKNLGLGCVG